ncbi:MAG: non-canonical purine NTP pyrophosphatase, RdgB/HAM1 family [Flavobacteriales bacterium]|nr:non-canonical purine NTP pyrophosphatase, RdgB/HAM1 family [Flavobacteriales bacterium]
MNLVFATNNFNKLMEINQLISNKINILSLKDINCHSKIPETNPTLIQNAFQKAEFIYEKFGLNSFADDTGLEIDALFGEPGVYSARYAGEECNAFQNIQKVLKKLDGISNRKAVFKTVIALIINGQKFSFEGSVHGVITSDLIGENGFGYDPIFRPLSYNQTFAQMSIEEKGSISHRGIAIGKLVEFLSDTNNYKNI